MRKRDSQQAFAASASRVPAINKDSSGGGSKGSVLSPMPNKEEAEAAIAGMNGKDGHGL